MIATNYVIGATFVTGQKAPVTGLYNFIGHVGNVDRHDCLAMTEECEIALTQGDTFPSHWSCGENVVWQLSHQSNRPKQTEFVTISTEHCDLPTLLKVIP